MCLPCNLPLRSAKHKGITPNAISSQVFSAFCDPHPLASASGIEGLNGSSRSFARKCMPVNAENIARTRVSAVSGAPGRGGCAARRSISLTLLQVADNEPTIGASKSRPVRSSSVACNQGIDLTGAGSAVDPGL